LVVIPLKRPSGALRPQFEALEIDGFLPPAMVPPCFGAGTPILTTEGDVAVEALAPGQELVLADGDVAPLRRVTACAIGAGVGAVRIAAGGLSMGVPEQALLLSPDHGLDFDGQSVPARELVDGVVICRQPAGETMFYTIDLATRGIILAGGAALESQAPPPRRGRPPAAPPGDALAGVRARLHGRKLMLGYMVVTLDHPRLEVLGQTLSPVSGEAGRFTFALPGGTAQAVLQTPGFVPAETDPSSADRRILGMALLDILVDGHSLTLDSVINPADLYRRGPAEHATWTRGPARLTLPARSQTLVVVVAEMPRYWRKPA
jgi:hypothetical protein